MILNLTLTLEYVPGTILVTVLISIIGILPDPKIKPKIPLLGSCT